MEALWRQPFYRYVNVEAVRGNIFSVDGSLLATSVPEYELHMDMLAGAIEDESFLCKVDSLAAKLSAFLAINQPSNIQRCCAKPVRRKRVTT
jgi:cell division protein FtsI (penicillin-binding protein 3)